MRTGSLQNKRPCVSPQGFALWNHHHEQADKLRSELYRVFRRGVIIRTNLTIAFREISSHQTSEIWVIAPNKLAEAVHLSLPNWKRVSLTLSKSWPDLSSSTLLHLNLCFQKSLLPPSTGTETFPPLRIPPMWFTTHSNLATSNPLAKQLRYLASVSKPSPVTKNSVESHFQ